MGETLTGLLYPTRCFSCSQFVTFGSEYPVCAPCQQKLRLNKPPYCDACGRHLSPEHHAKCREIKSDILSQILFALEYKGPTKKLIQRFKILNTYKEASVLYQLLREFLKINPLRDSYQALVPIPATGYGLRRVGPDASRIIAAKVSRLTGIPVLDVLNKKRPLRKQSSLNRKDRFINVQGAFGISTGTAVRFKQSVLLIDDVITTGATAQECARLLKSSGALKIGFLAMARGKM